MPLSTVELANAREIVTQMLDELRLDAYLFEVEPNEKDMEITIECAVQEGWETAKIMVAKDVLLGAIDDPEARQQLLEQWRKRLSDCLTKR